MRSLRREGAEPGVLGLVLVGHFCVIEEPAFVGVGADIGGSPAAIGFDGLEVFIANLHLNALCVEFPAQIWASIYRKFENVCSFFEESVSNVDMAADWL